MTKWTKSVALPAAAAALAAAGGCSLFGGDSEDGGDDAARLVDVLNESYALEADLKEAELRIITNCLEEQGLTVHDQYEFQPWGEYEMESLVEYYPHEDFILPAEEAEKYGFGMWANSSEGMESPEAEEYYSSQEDDGEEMAADEEIDNSEFEALDPEKQYEWYVAFYGEAYAEEYYSGITMSEDELMEEGATEEELAENSEAAEGEIDVEGDSYTEPKPGGCQLEMIESLYGEPEEQTDTAEGDGGGEEYTTWTWGPVSPEFGSEDQWETMIADYRAATQDQETALLDCLSGKQLGEWELNSEGALPVWEYFTQVYEGEDAIEEVYTDAASEDVELPELPDDLPEDYEGKKAYEIEVAKGVVACDEEAGYADAAKGAWEQTQVDYYTSIEEDLHAYQEDMRAAIEKAQGLIEG